MKMVPTPKARERVTEDKRVEVISNHAFESDAGRRHVVPQRAPQRGR